LLKFELKPKDNLLPEKFKLFHRMMLCTKGYRKLFLSENFEAFVWQETGFKITAGVAVATLRMILGSVTQPGGVHRNLQLEIISG